jgi:hypothetical protein
LGGIEKAAPKAGGLELAAKLVPAGVVSYVAPAAV